MNEKLDKKAFKKLTLIIHYTEIEQKQQRGCDKKKKKDLLWIP